MLQTLTVKKWGNFIFDPIFFTDMQINTSLWYEYHGEYIAPNVVTLYGDCFSGKTTLFNVLRYLRDIVVDNTNDFKEADIEVSFFSGESIYKYSIITCNKGFLCEIIEKNGNITINSESHHLSSVITRSSSVEIYNWFSSMLFIPSSYDSDITQKDFHKLNDAILFKYSDIIYPSFSDWYGICYDEVRGCISFSVNKHVTNFKICNLPVELRELFALLPLLDFFIRSKSSTLIIDDIDYIAKGLVKLLLQKRFIASLNSKYRSQLISFSNKMKNNVFTKESIFLLKSHL